MDQKQKLDAQLASGTFKDGSWSVSWFSGALVVGLSLSSALVSGSLSITVPASGLLDEVKTLIPNAIVDEVITVIETALKA